MATYKISQKPRILGFCFVVALVFLFASCGSKEDIYDTDGTVNFTSGKTVSFPGKGGSKTLVFIVDSNWYIEIPDDASWLSVSPAKGEYSSKRQGITITAEANDQESTREADLTFYAGRTAETIHVTQEEKVITLSASDVPNYDKIYIPYEFTSAGTDFLSSDDTWYFGRSKQSEHFIVFWAEDYGAYGDTTPADLPSTSAYYVDIDDLLEKAEEFYRVNVDELKFADTSTGKSNLNKYKMEIYILYQTEWLATGGGYDNVIGALWINPATCHPVGSTIAHEIGHSFQYMVYADAIANGAANDFSTGFRYEIGQGCGFWEQCAQWQSYQSYADQAFSSYNFSVFTENCHRHFIHEHQRYASYFLQWYWAEKYGVSEIGEIWRAAVKPEDPIQTYQRRHSLTMDQLNGELYEYAAKCVTWDFDVEATNLYEGKLTGVTQSIRDFGEDYIGKIGWKGSYDSSTGYYTVDPDKAPEATGFNHIRLNVPDAGESISVNFVGMPNADGFNSVSDASIAGWQVGFVSLLEDGSRSYSDPVAVSSSADITYEVPSNCKKLWMVVAATPSKYLTHYWDEDNTNDEVWPYKIKLTNTDLFGNISFTGDETPRSITINHSISTSAAAGYSGTSYTLSDDDLVELAYAFVLQPSEIQAKIPTSRDNVASGEIKVAAVQPDGSLSYNYTANGYGFWYNSDGSVDSWSNSYTYMEFTPSSWTCQFGVHPTKVSSGSIKAGNTYTDKFALVYGDYTATFVFTIRITE